ncbi:MAG: hypothetical protein K2P81_05260 [Bacteriovoracaceae bacterium]|nr:hypothetical protein [Bacteriovoracaceae bacterium]
MSVLSFNQKSNWNQVKPAMRAGGLNETLILNQQGPVSFHWSDFKDSCRSYQQKIEVDPVMKAEYESKILELERLQTMPVWIKSEKETTHTTLFNLYQDFILENMWQGKDAHPHAPYDISFISPSGPFKKISITDCFNIQTYQDFVMVFLLQGKLPQRDFRLRVPSKLLAEFGSNMSEVGLIDLQQITSSGLLLKCSSKTFFQSIRPDGQVRLMFKTSPLESANQIKNWTSFKDVVAAWGLNPFYSHNKQEAFLLNCSDFQIASRFDFGVTNEVYLFVSFEHLKNANLVIATKLMNFISSGKDSYKSEIATKVA